MRAEPGRARRVAPFAAVALLGLLAAVPVLRDGGLRPLLLAAALTVALVLGSFLLPWERLPAVLTASVPLAYFGVVALLRDATGGSVSALTPLVLLPIFWLALYGSRRHLVLSLVAMVVMLAAPIVLLGDPGYPATEWQRVVVWLAVASMVGLTTHHLVGSVRDLLARVEDLAETDSLTGLANRRGWDQRLRQEVALAERDGEPLSIALLDLDQFKAFNDAHGHQAGDRLLCQAAAAWSQSVREVDLLGRYGGEEFAVLLHRCDAARATEVVERMRASTPGSQTCSAGIAGRRPGEDTESLLARADRLLYAAKAAGRNRSLTLPPLPRAPGEGHRRPLVSPHLARLRGGG